MPNVSQMIPLVVMESVAVKADLSSMRLSLDVVSKYQTFDLSRHTSTFGAHVLVKH